MRDGIRESKEGVERISDSVSEERCFMGWSNKRVEVEPTSLTCMMVGETATKSQLWLQAALSGDDSTFFH